MDEKQKCTYPGCDKDAVPGGIYKACAEHEEQSRKDHEDAWDTFWQSTI